MRVLLLVTTLLCASALRYDAAQLQAWWNASAAGPGLGTGECPPEDACRRPAAPARVALLLRGESFRASPAQHTRDTCTEKSLAAQARVTATHYRLFVSQARYEQTMADVTEQTPLAAQQRPKSRKGLVAALAAVSLALGIAVSAVDRGFLAFSTPPFYYDDDGIPYYDREWAAGFGDSCPNETQAVIDCTSVTCPDLRIDQDFMWIGHPVPGFPAASDEDFMKQACRGAGDFGLWTDSILWTDPEDIEKYGPVLRDACNDPVFGVKACEPIQCGVWKTSEIAVNITKTCGGCDDELFAYFECGIASGIYDFYFGQNDAVVSRSNPCTWEFPVSDDLEKACYGSGSDGASATGVRLLALVAAVVAAL